MSAIQKETKTRFRRKKERDKWRFADGIAQGPRISRIVGHGVSTRVMQRGVGGYSPPSQCLCTSSLPASAPAIQHKTGEWAGSLGECIRTRDEPFSSTCWSVLTEDLRPGTHGVSLAVLVVQSPRGCTCSWLTFSFCANRGWNVHDYTAFSACTRGLSSSKTLYKAGLDVRSFLGDFCGLTRSS